MHARLESLEARPALLVEGDDLAVEDEPARPLRAGELAHLRVARREVGEVAPLQRDVAVVREEDRADPVPLDLEAVVLLLRGQLAAACQHRRQPVRHGLVARVLGRIHAMDQPVLVARAEERVAAAHALAVEGRDHLAVAELLGIEGASVPDTHRARAVLALRDVALELEVLERMVLGPNREPVLVRVRRDPARQRPGGERALVLEAQVPVQAAGVVLLHDEARALRLLASAPLGLGCLLEVALAPIAAEPVRHGIDPDGYVRASAVEPIDSRSSSIDLKT